MYSKEEQLKQKYEKKLKKAKQKSLSDLKKAVQRKINKFVRERDKDLPCVSCHRRVEEKDAGHYVAQGSSGALRFNLENLHGQCLSCNRFKHGNLIEYRFSLIGKIGRERVEWLEEHRNDVKKWTREELETLLEAFK